MGEYISDFEWYEKNVKRIEPWHLKHFKSIDYMPEQIKYIRQFNCVVSRIDGSQVKIKQIFGRKITDNMIFELSSVLNPGWDEKVSQGWFMKSEAQMLVYAFVLETQLIILSYNLPLLRCWWQEEGHNHFYREHIERNRNFETRCVIVPQKDIEQFIWFPKEILIDEKV
jgi:hypothetical protein